MKLLTLVVGAILLLSPAFSALAEGVNIAGTYNLLLYFGDSKPFLDELTLEVTDDGKLRGKMHVPNDFDSELEGVTTEVSMGVTKLLFAVPLPKKYHESFGRSLMYELHFLSRSPATIDYNEQFVGFVTHHRTEYRPTYIGSVVGFRKK
jgi:hypothetical protein